MWKSNKIYLSTAVENKVELWHRKLGNLNVQTMLKLANQEVVRGIPKLRPNPNFVCEPCTKGKHVKVQYKDAPNVRSKNTMELVNMDLMGPIQVESLTCKNTYLFW